MIQDHIHVSVIYLVIYTYYKMYHYPGYLFNFQYFSYVLRYQVFITFISEEKKFGLCPNVLSVDNCHKILPFLL